MTLPILNPTRERLADGSVPGKWWQPSQSDAQRIECVLCPRRCNLKTGDRGFCFVRENRDGQMVLATYGRSTGFCIDPIEKKPLNHFFPGTAVLSFGTAGCNLGCQFCQNWDISKSRATDRLSARAEPSQIAEAAKQTGCKSVAFTYNDPIIWAEYAIDTAKECHQLGLKAVAVTAGYIEPEAREEFFQHIDAANVDLKAFDEEFYRRITYSQLQPVLDTIAYIHQETDVWLELTNLIIPDLNDTPDELHRMCDWITQSVGNAVPIHFSAFHPDFRMTDRPRTDPEKLYVAYEIAKKAGLQFPYVGNVHDVSRQSTYCPGCSRPLIQRDWYTLGEYHVDLHSVEGGCCTYCDTTIPGKFEAQKGEWGNRRQPIRIQDFAITAPTTASAAPAPSVKETDMASTNSDSSTASPAATIRPQMMELDAIPAAQRKTIVHTAASWVAQAVTGAPVQTTAEALGELDKQIVMGVFVTLKRGNVLRGCCGVLGKPMLLGAAISSAATRTAKEDNRFAPISPSELEHLSIDVTLLGPFKPIEASGAARADAIEIGKQGITIHRGQKSGLLLPSVATERGWNATEFLQGVCRKAGLPIGAWESSESKLATFDGEAMGGRLVDFIPNDLPKRVKPPLSTEQLVAYAKLAGQNIVALSTGGTPSYVAPQLPDLSINAIVLTMQWQPDGQQQRSQGNVMQVSIRPGAALQATLYQMCQQAAHYFQNQGFTGQLQVGLTLGFDPALHGWGRKADLTGVDTSCRALAIADRLYSGFAFDADKSAEEVRDALRSSLPIGSRDATLHSFQVITTLPQITCVSGPAPADNDGQRPPAVAGKFYPAEDAARRALVKEFLDDRADEQVNPLAVMVPHAGLKYSGRIAADAWSRIADLGERTLLVVSPKHTQGGVNWSVCPFASWRLSSTTTFDSDRELAQLLADKITPLQLDAQAHEQEHGIEVQLPILEQLAPSAKVVGLAIHGGNWDDIQSAAKELADVLKSLEKPPLLVISSDLNHYAPDQENRRRDRLALDAMASCNPKQLLDTCIDNDISMCGVVPAALVMETLHQMGLGFEVQELSYATSADASGDKSQVVGYAGSLLTGV